MNIQQINQIVSDYDALNQLAISKVDILKTIDPNEYSTYKGIEEKVQLEKEQKDLNE